MIGKRPQAVPEQWRSDTELLKNAGEPLAAAAEFPAENHCGICVIGGLHWMKRCGPDEIFTL